MELTNLNSISFKFVADFKLLLIVNGQQTATSSCPCPFCDIKLEDLRSQKELKSFELKTYGNLIKNYDDFCSINKNKKLR